MRLKIFRLILWLAAVPISLQAQGDGGRSLELHGGTQFSFNQSQDLPQGESYWRINSTHRNYRVGLDLWQRILPRFWAGTGLEYSNQTVERFFVCRDCEFFAENLPQQFALRYLSVPLKVRYFVTHDKKTDLFVEVLGKAQVTLNQDKSIASDLAQRKYLAGAGAAFGISHHLSSRLDLNLKINYFGQVPTVLKNSHFRQDFFGLDWAIAFH